MSTPFYDLASLVVVPSGYKTSKVYAQKPLTTDGQLAFSRASTATRVNASGLIETVSSNVPRLDYLGSTCPKLLLEPSRTNDILHSSDLANVIWSTVDLSVVSNTTATLDPSGTNFADKIVEGTATSQHVIFQSVTGSGAVVSFFAKAAGRDWIAVLSNNGVQSFFNIANGTLGTIQSGSTGTITPYGNGWYRCTLYNSHPSFGAAIYLANANGNHVYAGDGTSGAYIWGVQLEASATYATSFIPSTTAAVTRLADAAYKTGISSLIGQTEGTIFLELQKNAGLDAANMPFSLSDGSSANLIYWNFDGGIAEFIASSATQAIKTGITLAAGTNKIAFYYKANDFGIYLNGVSIFTDTSGSVGAMNKFNLGSFFNDAYPIGTPINQALLFKTRLTNAQLAELTSL